VALWYSFVLPMLLLKTFDFPQKIYYSSDGGKGLYAAVSGTEKTQFRKEAFRYVRAF
jgi:hypothetical protein